MPYINVMIAQEASISKTSFSLINIFLATKLDIDPVVPTHEIFLLTLDNLEN